MRSNFFICLCLVFIICSCEGPDSTNIPEKKPWTWFYYANADNYLESDILFNDLWELRDDYKSIHNEINILVLIDRSNKYFDDTNVFGMDFNDTGLFLLTPGSFIGMTCPRQVLEVLMGMVINV